jgi:methionyl-tRNA formyltransferase
LFAKKVGIPVLQFKSVSREGEEAVKSFAPDVIVTASFGQILRQNILNLAPRGVINVHASLLPKYRGSCPINWAVINGENITGVTIMKTAVGLDTGDIISKVSTKILSDETAGQLSRRLAKLGAELLVKTLTNIEENKATFTPQNESESSYFPMLSKEMARLNFSKSTAEIVNFVRGMNPTEVAYFVLNGEQIRVFSALAVPNVWGLDLSQFKSGEVVRSSGKTGLVVKCLDGLVLLDLIQASGGKVMLSKCFLNGRKIAEKTQL